MDGDTNDTMVLAVNRELLCRTESHIVHSVKCNAESDGESSWYHSKAEVSLRTHYLPGFMS